MPSTPIHATLLLCCLAGAAHAAAPAAASTTAPAAEARSEFRFQPAKVRSGRVYHYLKSNLDGSQPWRFALYVASGSRIDVLKWNPENGAFVNVMADMDWTRFMPDHLEQWRTDPGWYAPVLSGRLAGDGRSLQIAMAQQSLPPIPLPPGLPAHVWGFDLASLNVALPHLVDPASDFRTGLVDPNKPASAEYPESPVRVGLLEADYQGEEQLNGIATRKYRIAGSGLEDQEGWLWVAKDGEYIVRAEHPVVTSTDWTSFKLDLQSTAAMSDFEWAALKRGVIAAGGDGGSAPTLIEKLDSAFGQGGRAAVLDTYAAAEQEAQASRRSDLVAFAAALTGREQHADAIALLQQVLKEAPRDVEALEALAVAQQYSGDSKAALATWQRLLKVEPKHAGARAQVAALQGK